MSRGYHIPCTPYLYLVPDSGAAAGMDCLPLQRSPGPFHYLIHEQAKSLVALQELQNEVGALLEFRDLVMETFPHLRTKMAAVSSSSQPPPSNIPVPLARSREWEPGVRVRRRLQPHGGVVGKQQDSSDTPSVTSLASRGRGGGKAPKSDGGGGSAVQDSGFGTETSSSTSKDASSGVGAPKSCAGGGGGGGGGGEEAEDELWNLLDVIHRKGTRLRDEVELLQLRLKDGEDLRRHSLDEAAERRWPRGDDSERRCESLGLLLDKAAAAEAEAAQLRAELAELRAAKRDLQQQLRVATSVTASSPGRRLGALDGIVSSPGRLRLVSREVAPDPAKVHAILRELDPIELQRHLLTTSVEKQDLEQRLEKSERSHTDLLEQLDKVRDENEDLRFQLEEKNIELEGTRARVRVLERLHHKSALDGPSLLPPAPNTILPLLALPMPIEDPVQQHHHSSSTESAHDQIIDTESKKSSEVPSSPRRRPSKIPLPGSKNCATPKPPSGKSGRSKDSSLSRSRFDSSSSLCGKNAKESSWKNRSDSSSSLSTSGKSKDSPSGRNSSLSSKSNKDSLNGVKNRESLSGKNRVDSLSKRSNTDSLSSGKMKDVSFSSTMSGSNKRDSVSGKKDSSFPSSGSRKSLHHQLSTRRTSNTNSSRANLIDHGDQNSKMELQDVEANHSLGDDFAYHAGESFSDSLDEEIGRLQFHGITDIVKTGSVQQDTVSHSRIARGAMYPWHSSSSEYFDSINNSSNTFDGTYATEPCPHEGPADCDSLERGNEDCINAKSSRKLWLSSQPEANEW